MKILIKNGRLVDPASGLDQVGDLAITASRITAQATSAPISNPTASSMPRA